jgi:hypothetical protein
VTSEADDRILGNERRADRALVDERRIVAQPVSLESQLSASQAVQITELAVLMVGDPEVIRGMNEPNEPSPLGLPRLLQLLPQLCFDLFSSVPTRHPEQPRSSFLVLERLADDVIVHERLRDFGSRHNHVLTATIVVEIHPTRGISENDELELPVLDRLDVELSRKQLRLAVLERVRQQAYDCRFHCYSC